MSPQPTHCAICSSPFMPGQRYLIDWWGHVFCESHRHEYPTCPTCRRIICRNITNGGVTYPDGRRVCQLCRATAVDTKEQAKPLVEAIAPQLYQWGLRFNGLILKIAVEDSVTLAQNRKLNPNSNGQLLGYIGRTTERRGQQERRIVNGVTVLSGLPRELFEGTVIHELGHAWLYLAKVDHLPSWQEEGFCNLLAYIYHKERPTPEARWEVKRLEDDPDPIYGEGFRRVRALFKKHGFGEALNYSFYQRAFPPE